MQKMKAVVYNKKGSPEKVLIILPAKISFEEGAALPMAALAALQALRDKGNIQKGQKVFID